jgi:hypothetical protein
LANLHDLSKHRRLAKTKYALLRYVLFLLVVKSSCNHPRINRAI